MGRNSWERLRDVEVNVAEAAEFADRSSTGNRERERDQSEWMEKGAAG